MRTADINSCILGTYLVGVHTYGQQETFLLEEGSSHQRPTLDTTQMYTEGGILVCSCSGIGGEREDSSTVYNSGNGLHQHGAGEKPHLERRSVQEPVTWICLHNSQRRETKACCWR